MTKTLSIVNAKMPRLVRADSDDQKQFLGVALDFGSAKRKLNTVPKGCVACDCGAEVDCVAIEISPNLHLTEYIEEEVKRLSTYVRNKARSGLTARGAKYVGPWFHPESAGEAPPAVRQLKPHHPDGEWMEPWHCTGWVKFSDPYTRVKMRFRIWRRVEKTSLKRLDEVAEEEANKSNALVHSGGSQNNRGNSNSSIPEGVESNSADPAVLDEGGNVVALPGSVPEGELEAQQSKGREELL
eukprot:CAMPEP_0202062128 /NCGR_PEP_ID=MMETSP0963-20130614/43110_1 /ASSEMBLY_ACC=CAM_ASM_000494 /TAXON_ID=4773 /ORGANISM="Schizochytrium aggregatum, Strain ATCC28209" /LENGTH=240 /DNA_ID=CAMNT_0048628411 /DNA_START=39 /DNA_END=761 /DNA_ORIENTATION=-